MWNINICKTTLPSCLERCKRESSHSFPPASFVDPTRAGLTETGRRRRRSMSAWKLRGHARTPTTPHTCPFPLALFFAGFPLPATALCSLNIAARGIDRLPHPAPCPSAPIHALTVLAPAVPAAAAGRPLSGTATAAARTARLHAWSWSAARLVFAVNVSQRLTHVGPGSKWSAYPACLLAVVTCLQKQCTCYWTAIQ
jgi:hypothetical protein